MMPAKFTCAAIPPTVAVTGVFVGAAPENGAPVFFVSTIDTFTLFNYPQTVADVNQTTKVPDTETVVNTYRLPSEVYEALRTSAFERRVPMNQIVIEAMRAYLDVA